MSTVKEQLDTIRFSVDQAKRRLKEFELKPKLTRAESFEKDMTVDCIELGEKLLKEYGR